MSMSYVNKRMMLWGIALLLGLAGLIQWALTHPVKPPEAYIYINKERLKAVQGSYCWSSWGRGTCADMVSAEELVDLSQPRIPAVASGSAVRVSFGVGPEELSVTVSFPSQERPAEAVQVTDGTFKVAQGAGKQYYILHGRWSSGSSSYVFALDVIAETSPPFNSKEHSVAWK